MKFAVFCATILAGNLFGEALAALVLGNPYSITDVIIMTMMQAFAVYFYVWHFGKYGDDLKPIASPLTTPNKD